MIDVAVLNERGRFAYLEAKAATMLAIEANFDESGGGGGLAGQLNDFWTGWAEVANHPGDLAVRSQLLQRATRVCASLNHRRAALSALLVASTRALESSIVEINRTAARLARLDQTGPLGARGPIDQQRRDGLGRLAELAGWPTHAPAKPARLPAADGQTRSVNRTPGPVTLDQLVDVRVGTAAATLAGGSARAQIEAISTTLPRYLRQLEVVGKALFDTVNGAHRRGFDLDGASGRAFFRAPVAANIQVAITDPRAVAASATGSGTPDLDATVALAISRLGASDTAPDAIYQQLFSTLATESQRVRRQSGAQSAALSSAYRLELPAGSGTDAQVANLVNFRRAYQTSLRVLSTVRDPLDQLFEHIGSSS